MDINDIEATIQIRTAFIRHLEKMTFQLRNDKSNLAFVFANERNRLHGELINFCFLNNRKFELLSWSKP